MTDAIFLLKNRLDGREMPLTGVISVGRGEECALRLPGRKLSRFHAEIITDGEEVVVEDLKSKNGTFVNDNRLAPFAKKKLFSGDKVRFDALEFEFLKRRQKAADNADATELRSGTSPTLIGRRDHRPAAWVEDIYGEKTRFVPITPHDRTRAMLRREHFVVDLPTLYIISGLDAGSAFEFRIDGPSAQIWTIGRQNDRNVCLNDNGISAIHATLRCQGGQWRLHDDLSRNGTFVNGARTFGTFLGDGDKLRFGPVECVIRLPRSAIAPAAFQWSSIFWHVSLYWSRLFGR